MVPTVNYNVCVHILLKCIWASDIKKNCNFGHVRLVISYTVCDNYDMLSIMMYFIGLKKVLKITNPKLIWCMVCSIELSNLVFYYITALLSQALCEIWPFFCGGF